MDKNNRIHIGFIILGACGHMGGTALVGLPFLIEKLQQIEVDVNLLYLVDPVKKFDWDKILKWCEKKLGYSPGIYQKIKDALYSTKFFHSRSISPFPIIIYDASPTLYHYDNFSEIISQNNDLFYLCEKPMILDPNQIKDLKNLCSDYNFFCELIETENPVFKKTKQYIVENNLKIKKLSFWRAGSSGIKKAICAGRSGVSGGALIDKAPHDFSITIGLLEPEEIKEFNGTNTGSRVIEADIHRFTIAPEYFLEKEQRMFLDASNHSSKQIEIDYLKDRSKLSADGLFSTSVRWKRRDGLGDVHGNYLFSWIGYTGYPDESMAHPKEKEFINRLNQLGFHQKDWLVIAEEKGPMTFLGPPDFKKDTSSARYKCRVEEVRIGVIECDKKTIVCNFLTKYKQLYRYAYAVNTKGKREPIYKGKPGQDSSKLKGKDVMDVFYAVSKACLKNENAKYIARKATLLTHQAILKAQSHAIDKLKPSVNSSDCFEKLLPIFKARIEVL